MIGMINLPTDGSVDFYAAAPTSRINDYVSRLQRAGRPTALANLSEHPSTSSNPKPPPSPMTREIQFSLSLFSKRQSISTHGYCSDGRKSLDGRPINAHSPSKLWDELLMRKMVSRILEEIASPVEHLHCIEKTFEKSNLLNRQISRSEPNLCSEDKSSTICCICGNVIDEELEHKIARDRSSSDLSSNYTEDEDSNDVLDSIISDFSTPSTRINLGKRKSYCSECS